MARSSLTDRLGGIGVPSWLSDWLGKDLEDVYREKYGGRYPGLAENVAAGVGTGLKAIGLPKHIAETTGRNITSLVEDWTPAGALTAVEEYGPLGGLAAVPVVGAKGKKVVKGLGKLVEEHLPNVEKTAAAVVDPVAPKGLGGIKAYHGSPHSFEEFDISKIGTGEGAQAYGHGLYFAENEDVARGYRNRLATGRVDDIKPDQEAIAAIKPKWDELTAQLRAEFAQSNQRQTPRTEAIQNQLDALNANAVDDTLARKPWLTKGSMYEVDIAADPEAFLDWDKPLSEQSPAVQEQLGGLGSAQKNRPLAATDVGRDVYYKQTQGLTSAGATERLKEAGIPGIKYLDQGSRSAGLGSRNYVVFDPKLIAIVKKYGLTAAIGMGLISEQMAQQMKEQGEI